MMPRRLSQHRLKTKIVRFNNDICVVEILFKPLQSVQFNDTIGPVYA